MAGQEKRDKEWSTRTRAIAFLAEHPNMSAAEAYGMLFNSDASTLQKAADGLKAGIVARKRAEVERMRKEIEAHDKTTANDAAAAKAAEVDARLNAQSVKAKTA
jgi:hypothetical protein